MHLGRARGTAVLGGLAGILVSGWVAVNQGGGPEGDTTLFGLQFSLSLTALAWSLVGVLGAIMRWRNERVPGAVMVAGGVMSYVALPDYFFVPAALLVIGGVAAVVRGGGPRAEGPGRPSTGPDS